jgi:hypothetical protein
MANGDTGQSKAPYIIICSGRIEVLAAKNNPAEQIAAASRAAADLTTFYDLKGWLTIEDSEPISELQNSMMTMLFNGDMKQGEAEKMVRDMFTMLSLLEQRYESERNEDGGYRPSVDH